MRALTGLVTVAVLGILAVLGGGGRGVSVAAERPSRADLQRAQDRIYDDQRKLGLQGVFVMSTGSDGDHLEVSLANPSPANRRLMRRRYGSFVRTSKRPGGGLNACSGFVGGRTADGTTAVPDVRGLSVGDAQRALIAAGLRFEIGCRGDANQTPQVPRKWQPESLGRITQQCPAAGQAVAADTSVTLDAVSQLPGGFPYRFGLFQDVEPPTKTPCADGRTLEDAPTPPQARVQSPDGYPVQIPADGTPTSVSSAGGTLVWLTSPNATDESG